MHIQIDDIITLKSNPKRKLTVSYVEDDLIWAGWYSSPTRFNETQINKEDILTCSSSPTDQRTNIWGRF